MTEVALNLRLHPKQTLALNTRANEVLYGGAAGGGKSHLMRVAAILWCTEIPGLNVFLFRRKSDDLIKNHMEGTKGFRAMLAPWVAAGLVQILETEIRFLFNNSRIFLCHCFLERDRFNYQGAEMHVLMIDEVTHFTETIYRFLRTRVRAPGLQAPEKYQGMFPRILLSGNPGGVGHAFIKEAFIDPRIELEIERVSREDGGMLRQYIPAKLEDNPSMAEDDPGYEQRLEGLGSPELVKAIRHGLWDVVAGAYFALFSKRHQLEPFEVPKHWTRFCSMDWGYAAPCSIGWWSVSDGTQTGELERRGLFIPRGSLVRYREWYIKGGANKGGRLEPSQVAAGIKARELSSESISYRVACKKTFAHDWGPSPAEMFAEYGIRWIPGDQKDRVSGWRQITQRLLGEEIAPDQHVPTIYTFTTCRDSIRTLPVLQHDENKIEDVGDGEDHAAEEWRIACMSRPWVRSIKTVARGKTIKDVTLNELWNQRDIEVEKRA